MMYCLTFARPQFPGIYFDECKNVFGDFPTPRQSSMFSFLVSKSDMEMVRKIEFKNESDRIKIFN